MSKSTYAEQFTSGRNLVDEIRNEQVGRLGRIRAQDRVATLNDWQDLAKSEAGVRDRYRGRFLFELIQNAHDAILEAEAAGESVDRHMRFELTDGSLLAANTGKPFDQNNVRAICRLHQTTKSATKQIGHKGIGFKSVLEITSTPEVYSVGENGGFAFGFDGAQFHKDVESVMGSGWDNTSPLPILRTPYSRNLLRLSPKERERIERLFREDYVSVIRLPWESRATLEHVCQRLNDDIQATLLLFMPAIDQIEIAYPDGAETWMRRSERPGKADGTREVILNWQHADERKFESRWLVLGPVQKALTNRSLVSEFDEAWKEVTALSFALAFPMEPDGGRIKLDERSQPFYVYFPTEEYSGVRFAVHADFQVRDDRKHLDTLPLNEWLLEEICLYLAGEGIAKLKAQWPHDAKLVDLLAPASRPDSAFGRRFIDNYLALLRDTPFVPVDGQQYKAPAACRFPPAGANFDRLRRLFPASKVRDTEWAYPTQEIVLQEQNRTTPFLLGANMGGARIGAAEIAGWLEAIERPQIEQGRDLVEFLADWWAESGYADRAEIMRHLADSRLFPTSSSWLAAADSAIFQANMRQDVKEFEAPAGFNFAVITRSVYPEQAATQSNVFRFFGQMGAKDYESRVLVQSILLPVLTDKVLFAQLHSNHPSSIMAAYRLLNGYFDEDRSTSGFADRLGRVLVPAFGALHSDTTEWVPAAECYLGPEWPGGDGLHELYAQFDDCTFLQSPLAMGLSDQDDLAEWVRFWMWFGVRSFPRLVTVAGETSIRACEYALPSGIKQSDWRNYVEHLSGSGQAGCGKGHPLSVKGIECIDHFDDFVAEASPIRLTKMYELIASHWSDVYASSAHVVADCGYRMCVSVRIDGFLLHLLRTRPWVPALSNNSVGLYAPEQVWILGETEPADVRRLVPTLARELRNEGSEQFERALGYKTTSSASIEDFLGLLEHFSTYFPLDVVFDKLEEQAKWQKSVRAVFNWVCEHIQTGLTSMGDAAPPAPTNLMLLAFRSEQPCYVRQGLPDLVYADDRRLAERWKDRCALFKTNDDWAALRKWLGIQPLSESVTSRWLPEGEIIEESEQLDAYMQGCIPYFLCLIKEAQPANYDRLLPRMRRISVQVVKRLTVEERFAGDSESKPLIVEELIHLEKLDQPNPRGGMPMRAARLFATPEVLKNPDLLGDLMADYVEIARLGDAFVILYERDDADRIRFLKNKGINRQLIDAVFSDLKMEILEPQDEDSAAPVAKAVIDEAIRASRSLPCKSSNGFDAAHPHDRGTLDSGTFGSSVQGDGSIIPEYPELDLYNVPLPQEVSDSFPAMHAPSFKIRGDPAIKGGSVPHQEVNEALGRRGEQWAYEAEKQRLATLGHDVDALVAQGRLLWVSDKNPTSNFDIRSIDGHRGTAHQPIYIEVKSTAGTSRTIRMSRSEFEFAMHQTESYWLYWVANVDETRPNPPLRYNNLAHMIAENTVALHLDKLALTLPEPHGQDTNSERI